MDETRDTIAAVSTPPGRGGIAVIRISGPLSSSVSDRVFSPRDGKPLSAHAPRTAVYGDIIGEDGVIDDGIALLFRAPASYTGEDIAEISCHGGVLLTQLVLEAVFAAGARPAGPGEFTKRAFLGGKLGLTKAESVIDLIDAESRGQIALASAQSRGMLSGRISELYDRMKRLAASIAVMSDYPDEDMSDIDADGVKKELSDIMSSLEELAGTYRTGRSVREGIAACICGRPNVGKSSLLNALAGEDRAIVTPLAGTTRDVISEKLMIGRCAVRISDTAGIRDTSDEIEKLGVERAESEMMKSELIIAVFDGSSALTDDDMRFIGGIRSAVSADPSKKIAAVINKSDLPQKIGADELSHLLPEADIVRASAGSGDVSQLESLIDGRFTDLSLDLTSDAVLSNARQYAAVKRASEDIKNALSSVEAGFSPDIAQIDIENAMADIAEVDGLAISADVVSDIFSRFCVGK